MLRKLHHCISELGRKYVSNAQSAVTSISSRCIAHTPSFQVASTIDKCGIDSDFIAAARAGRGSLVSDVVSSVSDDVLRVTLVRLAELTRAFRRYGHCNATCDPLNLPREPPFHKLIPRDIDERLAPGTYGLTPADLAVTIPRGLFSGHMGSSSTVGDCVDRLRKSYCGNFAVEFFHLPSEERRFFVDRIECPCAMEFTKDYRLSLYDSIAKAVLFENFCTKAFPTVKRFGADGLESIVVSLNTLSQIAQKESLDSVIMGMSHRGRLNVLVNILERPLGEMFAEFRGNNWYATEGSKFSGDVKYHFGYINRRGNLHQELINNPSHLQFVFPVVVGKARARFVEKGLEPSKVLPVVLHGDAAFSGEGVTYETVQMSRIPEYSVGGTINIVVNNQIGFTTYPGQGSSTRYPTDLAKIVESPTLHANAHDVEAVAFASRLAYEYRQKFGKDVFLNLVGFRKFGHNELDMPKFTNAEMYDRVEKRDDVLKTYRQFLVSNSMFEEEELLHVDNRIHAAYEAALKGSINMTSTALPPHLLSFKLPKGTSSTPVTGVKISKLLELGKALNTFPEDFQLHPAIRRIFKERVKSIDSGTNVDTGLAEVLAYASLADDGFRVRLAGQDSIRGTFSHRHSVIQCQKTFRNFNIFSNLKNAHKIEIVNSLLSETAAMAFEYGFGLDNPKILNIWEAQFGDFANVAQPVVDEFIVSGEVKWAQQSAICLLLPHGFDGQGPDHSSGRVERFLQLSDEVEDVGTLLSVPSEEHVKDVNIFVINCTRTSNLFHALRRQMLLDTRKPLVVMSGKKLLKLRGSYSPLSEFGPEFSFRPVIPDPIVNAANAKTLILCSGQVYFDLVSHVSELGVTTVGVTTVEQLCPFPVHELKAELERFPRLERLVWCQEEHANAGAWSYMSARMRHLLRSIGSPLELEYVGRPALASPSCGDGKTHAVQLQRYLNEAVPHA